MFKVTSCDLKSLCPKKNFRHIGKTCTTMEVGEASCDTKLKECNRESDSFREMSRRTLLETLVAASSLPLLAGSRADSLVPGAVPQPFHVSIPQSTIDRILNRVRGTRWPDHLESTDRRYGANWDYMKALAEYWTTRFDWRKAEANL